MTYCSIGIAGIELLALHVVVALLVVSLLLHFFLFVVFFIFVFSGGTLNNKGEVVNVQSPHLNDEGKSVIMAVLDLFFFLECILGRPRLGFVKPPVQDKLFKFAFYKKYCKLNGIKKKRKRNKKE